jgi:hypothetical protein
MHTTQTRSEAANFDLNAFLAYNNTTVKHRIDVLNKRVDYIANQWQWELQRMNEQERLRQLEYARQIEEQDARDRAAGGRASRSLAIAT